MADWSSLPSDLVDRIADRLLATNDVDCYMDFRAVCATWRSSTDDPKNSSELRFRPRRWIIIDGVFQSDSRLMVNTVSGRVVRKDLPLLRRFYVVATTHGGFFVLAEKKPPHAACVLNPFTGHLIQFMAPMLCVNDLSAAVIGSSPSIVLLSDKQSTFFGQHVADPDSECFKSLQEFKYQQDRYLMNRMAFRGGVYGKGEQEPAATFPVGVTRRLYHLVMLFPSLFPSMSLEDRCFIAEFSGQVFIIINLQHRSDDAGLEADSEVLVFKLDADSEVLEPVNSIGNLAIFVGSRRCLAVNAEKFPSIAASCIYYVKSTEERVCESTNYILDICICKYDLKEDTEERVCEAIHFVCTPTPPFTLIQILSSYTTNVRPSELEDEVYDGFAYEEALSDYLNDIDCWD